MRIQVQPIVREKIQATPEGRQTPIKKADTVNEWLYQKRLSNGIYKIIDDELNKRCSKCREYWPADTEFFNGQTGDDGLHTWCKACHSECSNLRKAALAKAKSIISQSKKS